MAQFYGLDVFQFVNMQTIQLFTTFVITLYISVLIIDKVKRIRKNYPPGPMGLPFFGYLPFLGEEPHMTMIELSKKYGNIFSLYLGRRYTVVLNEYESMKEGLSHPEALNRAPDLLDHITGKAGFASLNGRSWEEQRRFSMKAMRDLGLGKGSWGDLIHEEISSLLDELVALNGKAANIAPLISTSVSNNVVSLLIGRRLEKKTESDVVKMFYDFANVALKYMGPSDPASLIPGFRKFLEFCRIGGYHQVPTVMNNLHSFLQKEISRHKSSSETREIPNFMNRYLDHLETSDDSEQKRRYAFSGEMLEGNACALFLGGSDTIYNSMCFIIRLLAAHPEVQKKIQEEIDSVLGREGKARFEERTRTPYTMAAIMEMERWSTIVPLSTTRFVRKDFKLRGYTIPKGAEIFANTWAIHHDTRYWKEAEKYLPERFLSEDGTELLKLPSYVPFSVGKRNCPGETVAYMEMYLYLTSILQKFNISAPAGEKITFNRINGLVVQLEPQNLHFTLRDP